MKGLDDVVVADVNLGDYSTTTYLAASYPRSVFLEKGYLWEVVDFRIVGSTNYAAAADTFVFYLKDASGNTIATMNNAATGIAVNPATGIDSSPVAAYKTIDTESAASYLQIVPTISGVGKALVGLRAIVRLKQLRNS